MQIMAGRKRFLSSNASLKKCTRCGLEKPLQEFRLRNRKVRRTGERFISPRENCRPCERAIDRSAYPSRAQGERSRQNRRSRYRLSRDELTSLLSSQGGLCAICHKAPATCIDHEHSTGRVRGMLCKHCNTAVGFMSDDSNRLREAAKYLEAPPSVIYERVGLFY